MGVKTDVAVGVGLMAGSAIVGSHIAAEPAKPAQDKPTRMRTTMMLRNPSKPPGTTNRGRKAAFSALDKEKALLQECVKIRVSREDVIGKAVLPHEVLRFIIRLIRHKYWPIAILFACAIWTIADYEELLWLQIIAMLYVSAIFMCYFSTINVWCVLLSFGAFEPIYLLYNTVVCCVSLCHIATFAVTGRAFCVMGFLSTNILLSMIDATQMQKKARLILTVWLFFYWAAMLGCSYSHYRFETRESTFFQGTMFEHQVHWQTLFQNAVCTLLIFIAKDTFNEIRLKNGETKYLTKVVSFSWYDPGANAAYEDFDASHEGLGIKAKTLQEQAVCSLRRCTQRRRLPQEGFICGVTRAGVDREPAEVIFRELAVRSHAEAEVRFEYTWAEHRGVRLKEKMMLELQQLGAHHYFDVSVMSSSGVEMVSSVHGPEISWQHSQLQEKDFPVDVHAHVEAGLQREAFIDCWGPLARRRPVLAKFNRAMHSDADAVWAALMLLSDQAIAVILIQSQFRFIRSRRILKRARMQWARVARQFSKARERRLASGQQRDRFTLRQASRALHDCGFVAPAEEEESKQEESHTSADAYATDVSDPSKGMASPDFGVDSFRGMAPMPELPGSPALPPENAVVMSVAPMAGTGRVTQPGATGQGEASVLVESACDV